MRNPDSSATGWSTDPVIGTLVSSPRVIRLMPPLGPISVRDQAVRGHVIAERASRYWPPRVNSRGVVHDHAIVVGAGVAGVAAALSLVEHGYRVLLLDRTALPISRQLSTRGRWLDPHFYDWPACSYQESHFPVVKGVPLGYEACWADDLARDWYQALFTEHGAKPISLLDELDVDPAPLQWSPFTEFAPPIVVPEEDADDATIQVSLERLEGSEGPRVVREKITVRCALLLVAGGFQENLVLSSSPRHRYVRRRWPSRYRSPPYWHGYGDNWLHKPMQERSLRKGSVGKRVLIAGGGDGAIQDFLRIMTGYQDHRRLLEDLERCFGDELEACRRSLVVHDQSFWRGYAWASSPADERSYHVVLDQRHCEQAVRILRSSGDLMDGWHALLRQWRHRQQWRELHLFIRGDVLTPLFAFNRLMIWLVMGLGQEQQQALGIRISFQHEISAVESVQRRRDLNAGANTRILLRVTFDANGRRDVTEYDRVLLRFGIKAASASSMLAGSGAQRRPTGLLPPHYVPVTP